MQSGSWGGDENIFLIWSTGLPSMSVNTQTNYAYAPPSTKIIAILIDDNIVIINTINKNIIVMSLKVSWSQSLMIRQIKYTAELFYMSDHNVCRAFCQNREHPVLLDRTGTRRRPSSRRSLRMAPRCVSLISKATILKPRWQSHRRRWRRTVRRVLLQKTSSLKSISASSKRSDLINCSIFLKKYVIRIETF